MLGGISFQLNVRADLTPEEKAAIAKNKFGKTVLYTRGEMIDQGQGLLGLASRMAFKAMNISISVDDLANGKMVECKEIIEMLAVEEQVKEAFKTFKVILDAASTFGGEEVIAME